MVSGEKRTELIKNNYYFNLGDHLELNLDGDCDNRSNCKKSLKKSNYYYFSKIDHINLPRKYTVPETLFTNSGDNYDQNDMNETIKRYFLNL